MRHERREGARLARDRVRDQSNEMEQQQLWPPEKAEAPEQEERRGIEHDGGGKSGQDQVR